MPAIFLVVPEQSSPNTWGADTAASFFCLWPDTLALHSDWRVACSLTHCRSYCLCNRNWRSKPSSALQTPASLCWHNYLQRCESYTKAGMKKQDKCSLHRSFNISHQAQMKHGFRSYYYGSGYKSQPTSLHSEKSCGWVTPQSPPPAWQHKQSWSWGQQRQRQSQWCLTGGGL